MLEAVVAGGVWFFVFLVMHIVWFHQVHVEKCFALIVKIAIVCVIAYLGTILALGWGRGGDEIAIQVTYGLLVMGCLFIVYMPFYYTIVASLSIQTLIVLEETQGRSARIDELRQKFASTGIVAGRLNIMITNGYLTERDGRYRVTSKGRMIAKFFGYLKELWRLGPGG